MASKQEIIELKIQFIIQAIETLSVDVGCGDNSCRFITSTGMSTNGGCRCFKDIKTPPVVISLIAQIYKAGIELKKLGA